MKCKHCGREVDLDPYGWFHTTLATSESMMGCRATPFMEPDESATDGVIDFEDRKPILFMGEPWTSYKISYDKVESKWKTEN